MQTDNIGRKLILFLLNPFLSAINSLKDIRDGESHKILYLWFLMFGIGFCVVNDQLDSFRIIEDFEWIKNMSLNSYMAYLREYLTFDSNIKDIYATTVQFLVSRFTNNYHWCFLIFAAVFGFFYIKSLRIFLRYENVSTNWVFYVLLFMFCYSNSIFNINGMRFWTAAWIGVYTALSVILDRNYKALLWLVLTPFIHGSFIIWPLLLAIAFLSQRYQKVWITLFVASSFVSAVSYLNILQDYSYLLPQFMQNQVYSYTEADRALRIMAGETSYGVAYADFLNNLPGYLRLIMSYILIFNLKDINLNIDSKRLMGIFLSLATITNFLSGIPSMGRYQTLTIPLLLIIWAMNHDYLSKYDKVFCFVPLAYFYSVLYWYRHISSVTEFYLYAMPAPITIIQYLFY